LLVGTTQIQHAETIDGFVTNVTTMHSFDVGTIRIAFNRNTECSVQSVAYQINNKRRIHEFVRAAIHFSFDTLPLFGNAHPISCDALNLHPGMRMLVSGDMNSSGIFQAKRVSVYSVQGFRVFGKMRAAVKIHGGAVLEERPTLPLVQHKWSGNLWVDGYPLNLASSTSFRTAQTNSQMVFGYFRQHNGSPELWVRPSDSCNGRNMSRELFREGTTVLYDALRQSSGTITATYMCLWQSQPNKMPIRKHNYVVILPNYKQNILGSIRMYRHGNLEIIPDRLLQKQVAKIGIELLPKYAQVFTRPDPNGPRFRFFVVRAADSSLGYAMNASKGWTYGITRPSFDDAAIAMPDGLIAIPDSTLAKLHSSAQLAGILSFAITQVLQRQLLVTARSHQYFGGIYNPPTGPYFDIVFRDEQLLRIGIRQMYLAGYDIREAPFAWAVAQGRPVNNPVVDSKHPDKDIPWYTAYAFNYISQYYQNVDYSKLKRGRKEYQQFLEELRKADPRAFADQHPGPKQATKTH
jgi:hypothetical protein